MNQQLQKMRRKSIPVFLTILCFALVTCTSARYSGGKKQPEIRNVILMIGDGMGLATLSSAMMSPPLVSTPALAEEPRRPGTSASLLNPSRPSSMLASVYDEEWLPEYAEEVPDPVDLEEDAARRGDFDESWDSDAGASSRHFGRPIRGWPQHCADARRCFGQPVRRSGARRSPQLCRADIGCADHGAGPARGAPLPGIGADRAGAAVVNQSLTTRAGLVRRVRAQTEDDRQLDFAFGPN